MSASTFWNLVLKTLGMWLIINGFISLPGLISNFSAILTNPLSGSHITIEVIYSMLVFGFYFLILQFLILKSHRTIQFLKLEKGFEKMWINLALPYGKLLKISILIIGGALLFKAIPNLVESLYSSDENNLLFGQSPKTVNVIIYVSQVVISFLIMVNSNTIQRYLSKGDETESSSQLSKEKL